MSPLAKPSVIPIEFAGKWIAWDYDESHIIASGQSYQDAKRMAEAAGEMQPVLEKVPDARVRFIGGHR